MTKIMYIASGSKIGGGEKNLCDIIKHMPDSYEVAAIAPEHDILSEILCKIGCKVFICDVKLQSLFQLLNILKKEKPDLVHIHGLRASFAGRIACRIAKVPCVYTMHGIHYLHYGNSIKKWVYLTGDKFLRKWTDSFICVSKSVFDQAIDILNINKNKVWLIYNGIDYHIFCANKYDIEESGSTDNRPIVCIGRLQKPKGQIHLLKAISLINQTYPKINYLIIGEGEDKEKLSSFAAKNNLDNVTFTGATENVFKVLNGSRMLIVPSIWEGFPYIILEAMASGLPVIATNVGGIPEIVVNGQTGILIPPKNEYALSSAIINLLENPGPTKKMSEAGMRRVLDNFTIDKMVEQTLKVYDSVLTINRLAKKG